MPFEADSLDRLMPLASAAGSMSDAADDVVFEGHVDFYGYHAGARGSFYGGWITHPWPQGHRPTEVMAQHAANLLSGDMLATFYFREDVAGRGIGFVFFIAAPSPPRQTLDCLQIRSDRASHVINPTREVLRLERPELVEHLATMLGGGEDGSQRRRMHDLLLGTRCVEAAGGFIDFHGYNHAAGGWLLGGWAGRWPGDQPPERVVLSFEDGDVAGAAIAARFSRQDLAAGAEGIVLFVSGGATQHGGLCSVSYDVAGAPTTLYQGTVAPRLREAELAARLRPVLAQMPPGDARDSLQGLLVRPPYTGEDTLAAINAPVFLEIDEAIQCGADGLLLIGWFLAKPGVVRDIRVRCGKLAVPLDLERSLRVDRPDVLATIGEGFDDACCGFIAYLEHAVSPDGRPYIEIETTRRAVGYRSLPRPKLEGIAAIRRVLDGIDLRFGEVRGAFDRVLGPAVEALNRVRLARRPTSTLLEYGHPPARPTYSVIVPLYGRLDFMEYQLALVSAHPGHADTEFIYVLDEPARRKEAQALFTSVHARFRVPFRAVLLDRNVGFAPANNIGLDHARGQYVAFVNSDVFPGTPDWLPRLAQRLQAEPALAAVGPQLLFEDGSVQHRGMSFHRLADYGDWFFPLHEGKGLRCAPGEALLDATSITGACMVMKRSVAQTVGGFDEIYAVGDFEDCDLCLKLQALGFRCAVDPTVTLYHLERQSQASAAHGWRMNLTLYNAWQHDRRWGATIAGRQAATP